MAVHIKNAGRYREIAMALMRHGFGYIVEEISFFQVLSLPRRWITHETGPEAKTLGERIRHVLEDLGPTFVKLGQLASTRSDLLPSGVISELTKLQDQVPPFSPEIARGILEQELNAPLEELLAEFDDTPLAAASIGQVHIGRLRSGEQVAIKIQRPGISPVIQRDLNILKDFVALAERRWEWVTRYQLREMVKEFAASLLAELDYSHEGRNTEKVGLQFMESSEVHVPKIFWDYTRARVLTMEYMDGIMLNQREVIIGKGYDLKNIAQRLVDSMLHQIFIEGFFHADPHPGNLMVMKNGTIAFLDFGMVGRLNEEMKEQLSSLIIALMRKNTEGMVRSIERLGMIPEGTNMGSLRRDLDRIRDDYYDIPFASISVGQALNDLFGVAQRHQITLPSDVILLGKALVTLEGVIENLDPTISIIDMAEPFGRKLIREKFSSRKIKGKLLSSVTELIETLVDLPGQARLLTSIISKGKLKVEISIPELEQFEHKLDQISNKLSLSIVLLAFCILMVGLFIGSSKTEQVWHVPLLEVGIVIAGLMVLWLIISIIRSGKQ
ncbi:AarF/ABC1/UbiB kinase family protein [Paenibacillus sp. Marseille-Q4541]|uniref:ABC1 kinase family protein n=1 Tax=Paenibacillus sp. Marseille-Q4541 TaxID=2831522 RepID=UPI001BAE46D5|nr:AarF/ABC1/UbiB kinase family protein [Paenibacillus sp. Marseille-Q4541]